MARCRWAKERCGTSSCVSVCTKAYLIVVNFVFLVSALSLLPPSIDDVLVSMRNDTSTASHTHKARKLAATINEWVDCSGEFLNCCLK